MAWPSFLRDLFTDRAFARKRSFLDSVELFKGLNAADAGRLAQSMNSRTYHAGETLFAEGEVGRALFVLESGRVALTRQGPSGEACRLAAVEPGGFFGERALLEQAPRSATATAEEESRIHLLDRSTLETLVSRHPRIGAQVMTRLAQSLSARLRRAAAAPTAPHEG